jgi:hypothetical protein
MRQKRKRVVGSFQKDLGETYDRKAGAEFLTTNGWPKGLQETLFASVSKIAMRFFIVDDSGEDWANVQVILCSSILFYVMSPF